MVVVVTAAMAAASLCCGVAAYLYYVLWLAPERLRAHLRRQGIGGPTPSFPYGNLADMRSHAAAAAGGKATGEGRQEGDIVHDYRQAVFPFYENWRKQYGTHVYIDQRPYIPASCCLIGCMLLLLCPCCVIFVFLPLHKTELTLI